MVLHVELIQNEWAAGQQRVVAKLLLDPQAELRLETGGDATWEPIVLQAYHDPATGQEISPEDNPEEFLRGLHAHLNGDYLFATEAHPAGECEYEVGSVVPITGRDATT